MVSEGWRQLQSVRIREERRVANLADQTIKVTGADVITRITP